MQINLNYETFVSLIHLSRSYRYKGANSILHNFWVKLTFYNIGEWLKVFSIHLDSS